MRTRRIRTGFSLTMSTHSTAPARRPAGVAFEAGAVADQGEVAAFGAAVALVALDAGGADGLEAEIPRPHGREGEGAVDVGVGESRERGGAAGAAVEHRQLVADEAVRGGAAH